MQTEEVEDHLKQIMLEKKLQIPYDPELINQLNIETLELTKEGREKFSHPGRTHDDQFWALALACFNRCCRVVDPVSYNASLLPIKLEQNSCLGYASYPEVCFRATGRIDC